MITEKELAQKRDYREYLQSSSWLEKRKAAIARAEGRCQLCNSTSQLQVHHRTYERVGDERPQDLVTLCDSCHYWFHKARFGSGGGAAESSPQKIFIVKKGVEKEERAEAFKVKIPERSDLPLEETEPLVRKKWGDLPKAPQPRKAKKNHRKRLVQVRGRKPPAPGSSPYFPRKVKKGEL
jgi:hypothetical protein